MKHTVEHDKKYQQFSIALGEEEAELAYATPAEKVLDFTHTYVPEDARGNGVANELIKEGFKYAEENGYRIIATCPAVKTYLQRHPEYNRLLKEE